MAPTAPRYSSLPRAPADPGCRIVDVEIDDQRLHVAAHLPVSNRDPEDREPTGDDVEMAVRSQRIVERPISGSRAAARGSSGRIAPPDVERTAAHERAVEGERRILPSLPVAEVVKRGRGHVDEQSIAARPWRSTKPRVPADLQLVHANLIFVSAAAVSPLAAVFATFFSGVGAVVVSA